MIVKPASERVIINAPMSFAGAAQRAWRLRRGSGAAKAAWTVVAVTVVVVWWLAVVAWYVVFSVLLIPYRILRRGARKRKAEARRHRELLDAVSRQQAQPPT